jgi:hypothetical protein
MLASSSLPADRFPSILRRGLLALAALTTAGIAVELAVERHWTQPGQLIAWAALALLLLAIGLLARRHGPGQVRIARALASTVMLISLVGVWQHIAANYDAGPLDFRYADVWDNLSELTRWWLAVSKTVGAAPPLAPGALAQAAIAVLLASIAQPALERMPKPYGPELSAVATEGVRSAAQLRSSLNRRGSGGWRHLDASSDSRA